MLVYQRVWFFPTNPTRDFHFTKIHREFGQNHHPLGSRHCPNHARAPERQKAAAVWGLFFCEWKLWKLCCDDLWFVTKSATSTILGAFEVKWCLRNMQEFYFGHVFISRSMAAMPREVRQSHVASLNPSEPIHNNPTTLSWNLIFFIIPTNPKNFSMILLKLPSF